MSLEIFQLSLDLEKAEEKIKDLEKEQYFLRTDFDCLNAKFERFKELRETKDE